MKKAVIAQGLSTQAKKELNDRSITVLDFGFNPSVSGFVANHADLSFLYDGYDTLFVAKEMSQSCKMLKGYIKNIVVIPEKLGNEYPDDVKLNCVANGNSLICNIDTIADSVLKYFKNSGYRIINVKQGYTKCSVVPVSDNAIITDDASIAHACIKNGFDVLSVSKGSVKLPGYEYGFIGGASGKIASDIIAFSGNIDSHVDSVSIKKFLEKYHIKALSLDNSVLYDIGSIIPLYGGL